MTKAEHPISTSRLRTASEVQVDQLRHPDVRAAWDRLAPARAIALRLVAYRADHGLTQTSLGRKLGMPQPTVARLESGDHVPSLETLVRLSDALEIEFLVDITPRRSRSAWVTGGVDGAVVIEKVATGNGGELLVAAS